MMINESSNNHKYLNKFENGDAANSNLKVSQIIDRIKLKKSKNNKTLDDLIINQYDQLNFVSDF